VHASEIISVFYTDFTHFLLNYEFTFERPLQFVTCGSIKFIVSKAIFVRAIFAMRRFCDILTAFIVLTNIDGRERKREMPLYARENILKCTKAFIYYCSEI